MLNLSKAAQTGRLRSGSIYTPKQERKQLEKECLRIWSEIVRKRDGCCQHCGRKERGQAHHIISRTRLQRMKNQTGKYDTRNGVRLCQPCHFYWLKDYCDEYSDWLDKWLATKGMWIGGLLALYSVPGKVDLRVTLIALKQELAQCSVQHKGPCA